MPPPYRPTSNPTSNVIRPAWNPDIGFVTPDETEILVGAKQDINGAFGGGLNMINDTPQGQLAVSTTAIIGYVNDTFIFFQNMVDPAYSRGRMQDAIGRLYFISRHPPRPTTVEVVCIGLKDVVIPVDTVARDRANNEYVNLQTVTIDDTGRARTTFANRVTGPIPCPSGSLNRIVQNIPGWDALFNPTDGALGRDTETPREFEWRRSQSTAKNGMGSMPCILGSVFEVKDVTDCFVTENTSNKSTMIGGAFLIPNSIYVAAVGGKAEDIARAIWKKKAPGCGYNGNTSVVVYDTSSGYRPPYPNYNVMFTRPDPVPVVIQVTLQDTVAVPSNALTIIRRAIIRAFAGADGGPRCTIGAIVYASRFYCPVRDAMPANVRIIHIKVGSTNVPVAIFKGFIDNGVKFLESMKGEEPEPEPEPEDTEEEPEEEEPPEEEEEEEETGGTGRILNVEEVIMGRLDIGTLVVSNGAEPGTIIENQINGDPGGVGQYTVNINQKSEVHGIMYAIIANYDEFPVHINQMPTITDEDITLKLVKAGK